MIILSQIISCIKTLFQGKNNKIKYEPSQNYSNKYENDSYSNDKSFISNKDEFLYVILPYFNYCYSLSRFKLFIEFVKRYSKYDNIRICIVEGRLKGESYQLPDSHFNVYKHIAISIDDPIWIKENLINIMVSMLPKNWKYIAWIDADITFLNRNWINDTLESLKNHIFV